MISIKDFVKQVVSDIEEAKKEESSILGIRGIVNFDIAVVANQSGGAGMKVGVLGIGSEFGGNISNEVTSRIRFSIQTRGAIAPGEPYKLGSVRVKEM